MGADRVGREMIRRQTVKRDRNHAEVVKALTDAGCGVIDLSKVGDGCPDILAHGPTWPHTLVLIEIKDGELPPSHRKLTKAQEALHASWHGYIHVCKTVGEALAAMGIKS
jgi:hypothetical protein